RMAARTGLGKHNLAAIERRGVSGQMLLSSRCVRQMVRLSGLDQEFGHVERAHFGGSPIGRSFLSRRDLDRRDLLAAKERIEMRQPIFAVETNVEIDTAECT